MECVCKIGRGKLKGIREEVLFFWGWEEEGGVFTVGRMGIRIVGMGIMV